MKIEGPSAVCGESAMAHCGRHRALADPKRGG
jgi:hypothetical protein